MVLWMRLDQKASLMTRKINEWSNNMDKRCIFIKFINEHSRILRPRSKERGVCSCYRERVRAVMSQVFCYVYMYIYILFTHVYCFYIYKVLFFLRECSVMMLRCAHVEEGQRSLQTILMCGKGRVELLCHKWQRYIRIYICKKHIYVESRWG